jgi:PEP-CTERM motif-containing protein
MMTQCAQSSNNHSSQSQFTFRRSSMWIVVLASVLLVAPGVFAQTNVDFFCSLGGSTACTGSVAHAATNFSASGISVFNDSGPFTESVPFTLAFNTAAATISIDGTGMYAGMNLIGKIISFASSFGGSSTDFSLVADWPTLPAAVQTQLGTSTGMDSGFVIYLSKTGGAQSVDVLITPRMSTTPEPASMLLVGSGLLAIGGLLRRRRVTT